MARAYIFIFAGYSVLSLLRLGVLSLSSGLSFNPSRKPLVTSPTALPTMGAIFPIASWVTGMDCWILKARISRFLAKI